MFASQKTKRRLVILFIIFLLCLTANVVFGKSGWMRGFPMIITGGGIVIWLQTIRRRIILQSMRNYMTMIAFLLLCFCFLQLAMSYFASSRYDIQRYLWYSFYIVQIIVPLLCFFLAFTFTENIGTKRFKKRYLLWIPAVILISIIFTNDFHQIIFTFPQGFDAWQDTYKYNYGFHLYLAWLVVLFSASLIISFRFCITNYSKSNGWIPLIPLAFGIIYCVIYIFNNGEFIIANEVEVLPLPQAFCLIIVNFIESLIQIGVLPSNDGYKEFFEMSSINAQISDLEGNVVIESVQEYSRENPVIEKYSREILGGRISWNEDISVVSEYQDELKRVQERLINEESLLRESVELKTQQATLIVANRIYDKIPKVVESQLSRINEIIDGDYTHKEDFDKNLFEACVLNSYIKRRSNLMIIASGKKLISLEELFLSIRESLETLKAKNIKTGVFLDVNKTWSVEDILTSYDFIENIIESHLFELKSLFVDLNIEENAFLVRIMASGMDNLRVNVPEDCDVAILGESDGVSCRLMFKGGAN